MEAIATTAWRDDTVELFLLGEEHVGDDYLRWLADPRVNRFLESRFAHHDAEGTRAFVAQCRADAKTLFLGIRSRALDGRHVGNIKLGPIDHRHGLGEIGLMIGEPEAWGRGIGRSAIARMAAIAFDELGLRKLTAGCYASNVGSEQAFLRAGFHREGVRGAHFLLDGQPEDLVLLARLR